MRPVWFQVLTDTRFIVGVLAALYAYAWLRDRGAPRAAGPLGPSQSALLFALGLALCMMSLVSPRVAPWAAMALGVSILAGARSIARHASHPDGWTTAANAIFGATLAAFGAALALTGGPLPRWAHLGLMTGIVLPALMASWPRHDAPSPPADRNAAERSR